MRQKAGKQWRKHGSFTIIRNPYGRAVSSWKWVKSKTGKDSYGGFKSYLDKLIRGQIKDNMALWHATSQLRHITDASGSYLVDRILRQEKLQQDYDQLRSWLGLGPKQLPHHNKSGYKSYKSFYDDECREMVQQLYSEDIARFNYQY